MRLETFQCAECGVLKQVSNHWVLAYNDVPAMIFQPWDEETARAEGIIHICGEGCAAKVLSKQVSSWKALA